MHQLSRESKASAYQMKEFFVDTKTTCFLCLRENVKVHDKEPIKLGTDEVKEKCDPTINGRRYSTRSRNVCHGAAGSTTKSTGKQFCMRSIYKHLKITSVDILGEGEGSLIDSVRNGLSKTDLAVLLCGDCTKIAEGLSDVCLEMEVLQMKVDHSLQKFVEVLNASEEDPSKIKQLRSKLKAPEEMLIGSVVEVMRRETKAKIDRYFDPSIPKVNSRTVPKLALNKIKTPETPASSVQLRQASGQAPANVPSTGWDDSSLIKPARFKCKICDMAFGSRKGLYEHHRRRHRGSPFTCLFVGKSHICQACGLKLFSKADWIRHTRLHCSKMKRGVSSTKRQSEDCQVTKSVTDHQQDSGQLPVPVYNPLTGWDDSSMIKPARFKCKICDMAFGSHKGLYEHHRRRHQGSSFISMRMRQSHTCQACGLKLSSKADWIRHTRLQCSKMKKIYSRTEHQSEESQVPGSAAGVLENSDAKPKGARSFRCNLCGMKCKSRAGLEVHKLRKHSTPTVKEANVISAQFPCAACGTKLRTKPDWIRHTRLECTKTVERFRSLPATPKTPIQKRASKQQSVSSSMLKPANYKCDTCGIPFTSKGSVAKHYKRRHERQHLPEVALPESSAMNCSTSPIQTSSNDSFETSQISSDSTMEDVFYTNFYCQVCSQVFQDADGANRHICSQQLESPAAKIEESYFEEDENQEEEIGMEFYEDIKYQISGNTTDPLTVSSSSDHGFNVE